MDFQGHNQAPPIMMGGGPMVYGSSSSTTSSQFQPGANEAGQQYHQQLQQQLQSFWGKQQQEAERTTDFKNHSLPLARIKKIMKADEDVRMISAEAPVVFARACEMFVLELTLRAWAHTEENKRRTLQKNDIAAAITRTDIFDFLVDIVPREDLRDEGVGVGVPVPVPVPPVGPADSLSYWPPPPPHQHGTMMMDNNTMYAAAGVQHQQYMAAHQHMWPQQQHSPPPEP